MTHHFNLIKLFNRHGIHLDCMEVDKGHPIAIAYTKELLDKDIFVELAWHKYLLENGLSSTTTYIRAYCCDANKSYSFTLDTFRDNFRPMDLVQKVDTIINDIIMCSQETMISDLTEITVKFNILGRHNNSADDDPEFARFKKLFSGKEVKKEIDDMIQVLTKDHFQTVMQVLKEHIMDK